MTVPSSASLLSERLRRKHKRRERGEMADDTEKAIIYAFDQSGAVAPELRQRALTYLQDLQVRRTKTKTHHRRRRQKDDADAPTSFRNSSLHRSVYIRV
jgi:hypothetical protein